MKIMRHFAPIVAVFVAGCNQVEQPISPPVVTQRTEAKVAPKPVPTMGRIATGLAQAFRDQNPPPKVPATARTIEPFHQLKLGMTRREVIARVGVPDKDVGSGIYIDIYKLSDASTVTLGSGGPLIYAHHRRKNGSKASNLEEILNTQKSIKKSS